MPRMTMIEAIRDAMDVMMARDDNVVVFGEDVGYFGGVFRCTEGLQAKYGKTRCFDTPINECGIVGAAIGMAAYGLRPVRRDPVRRLHLSGLRPDRVGGRAAALPLDGEFTAPWSDPHADRRRHLRRPDPQPEPGGAVHPRLRPQDGRAVEPLRRQGAADRGDRGRRPVIFLEPKRLYNGPFDGHHDRPVDAVVEARARRGAGRPLHRPARQGRDRARRARRSRCSPTARWCMSPQAAAAETGIDAEIIDLRTLCRSISTRSSPR